MLVCTIQYKRNSINISPQLVKKIVGRTRVRYAYYVPLLLLQSVLIRFIRTLQSEYTYNKIMLTLGWRVKRKPANCLQDCLIFCIHFPTFPREAYICRLPVKILTVKRNHKGICILKDNFTYLVPNCLEFCIFQCRILSHCPKTPAEAPVSVIYYF